jgi:hypothetical protein
LYSFLTSELDVDRLDMGEPQIWSGHKRLEQRFLNCGARVVCMRDIFILNEHDKLYILVSTLLVSNMKLALFCNSNFTKVYINLEKYVIH